MYCGGQLTCLNSIRFRRFEIPVYGGVKIYTGQISDTGGDFHQLAGEIVRNRKNPDKLGLRNLTDSTWSVKLPDNSVKTVEPDGIMPVLPGFEINVGSASGTVI